MINYDEVLSSSVVNIKPSGIRKFFDIAEQMEGVISLGVGEPDFKTPWHIRQAGISSLEKSQTRYTSNWGLLELRKEIAKYLKRKYSLTYKPESEVLVTVGGSEAIDVTIRALVNSGDEVIIPSPSFVCYEPIVSMAGGTPVIIDTKVENEFRLTADELKGAITDKTKLLILPFPNNPTGAIMEREHLEEIAEVLKVTNFLVLSDEIYAELTYGGISHTSIAQIDEMAERTVLISGFSKAYSMTGWRLGYACGPEPVLKQMTKIHQYCIMSSPTTSQYAAIEALKHGDEDIANMLAEYDVRRTFIVNEFNKMGLETFEPKGAFYVFPCIKSTGLSSEEFCEKLLMSKRVAAVPGNAFGESGEGFIRVSYCNSLKNLKRAVERIKEFLKEIENG
ncbi:MAG: aminotransferase class I/II-fold pyridoxal phosphate-dependent enzyme [Clostridia bacterium]|nr:aminotransferase class I/II-fold pyridoxal phosphate-dependent enzyme [Clostridia bacterium]